MLLCASHARGTGWIIHWRQSHEAAAKPALRPALPPVPRKLAKLPADSDEDDLRRQYAPSCPLHPHDSPYLSPGGNCETRLAWTHTHRDDMENEDWNA